MENLGLDVNAAHPNHRIERIESAIQLTVLRTENLQIFLYLKNLTRKKTKHAVNMVRPHKEQSQKNIVPKAASLETRTIQPRIQSRAPATSAGVDDPPHAIRRADATSEAVFFETRKNLINLPVADLAHVGQTRLEGVADRVPVSGLFQNQRQNSVFDRNERPPWGASEFVRDPGRRGPAICAINCTCCRKLRRIALAQTSVGINGSPFSSSV